MSFQTFNDTGLIKIIPQKEGGYKPLLKKMGKLAGHTKLNSDRGEYHLLENLWQTWKIKKLKALGRE